MNLQHLAAAGICLPIIMGTQAHATGATSYSYSPMSCQTFGGTLWIYPSGQISNRGTDTMRVFCPLIHEAKFNTTQDFSVSVVNDHPTQKIRCRVFFNHPHALEWEQTGWKGENDLGHQKATIPISGRQFLGGGNMLECEIPRKVHKGSDNPAANFDGESRIGSYRSGVD
jgi:hypothetical protein